MRFRTGGDRTRHAAAGAVVLSVAIALSGCSASRLNVLDIGVPSVGESLGTYQSSLSPQVSTPTIIQSGTLTVGVPSGLSAPICSVNDGQAQGMGVDLASLVAQQLGLKVAFVSVNDPETAVGRTCDVVIAASQGSYEGVTAVGSYAERAYALFGRTDDVSSTGFSASSVSGHSVAVVSGTASASALKASGLEGEEKDYATLGEAFEDLSEGSVDFVLCSAYQGAYLARAYESISCLGTVSDPEAIGIGVASTNSSLQQSVLGALEQVQSDGREDIVRSRWVGSFESLDDTDEISGADVSAVDDAGSTSSSSGSSSSASSRSSSSGSGLATAGSTSDAQDGSNAGANAVVVSAAEMQAGASAS